MAAPIILGLSLIQRAALAARRAGYRQVFLLGGAGATRRELARRRRLAEPRRDARLLSCGAVIIAPAAILGETDWLERLASTRIEPAGWGIIPNRIVVLPARRLRMRWTR